METTNKSQSGIRPPLSPEKVRRIIELYEEDPNLTVREIASKVPCGVGTVQKYVKKYENGEDIPQLSEAGVKSTISEEEPEIDEMETFVKFSKDLAADEEVSKKEEGIEEIKDKEEIVEEKKEEETIEFSIIESRLKNLGNDKLGHYILAQAFNYGCDDWREFIKEYLLPWWANLLELEHAWRTKIEIKDFWQAVLIWEKTFIENKELQKIHEELLHKYEDLYKKYCLVTDKVKEFFSKFDEKSIEQILGGNIIDVKSRS